MNKKITSALISVFNKDGLEKVANQLIKSGVTIYSTGGTQKFLEELSIKVTPVEELTAYPPILGGRVKTLHPKIFGGILARREVTQDLKELSDYEIPEIDLVIVDLYPFKETVAETTDESKIIEKIDIGGPSMIRAAAKNFNHVTVVASKDDYELLETLMKKQGGEITLEQRREFAAKAFSIVADYDNAINDYFIKNLAATETNKIHLRYGENPHQDAHFVGDLKEYFTQLHGKEISYNNLVDIDAAIELISEFTHIKESGKENPSQNEAAIFAIIKHTNVCGIASRNTLHEAWENALAGDPESAFGGVLVCNYEIDLKTAEAISELFFEVLIAPSFASDALNILKGKKNRILLQLQNNFVYSKFQKKNILNGELVQKRDEGNFNKWEEVGGRNTTDEEKSDLEFANLVCKHLKSNAIALVKNKMLIGKGCGQTSRIDSLRQAIEKAKQFEFDLKGAVLASDAFFPFDDCVKMGHEAQIAAFIQPGGSLRDKDSISYCQENNLALVLTGMRHFKH